MYSILNNVNWNECNFRFVLTAEIYNVWDGRYYCSGKKRWKYMYTVNALANTHALVNTQKCFLMEIANPTPIDMPLVDRKHDLPFDYM